MSTKAKKCPPKDNECVGLKIAAALQEPKAVLSGLLEAKIAELSDSATKYMVNVKNGVTEGVKATANILPSMIDSTGKSIAGVFTTISKSFTDAIDNASAAVNRANSAGLPPCFPNIIPPLEVLLAGFVVKIQSALNALLLGKNANEIMQDPKNTPEKLWEAVSNNSEFFNKLSKDPEFQSKFLELIAKFTESILNSIDVAQPEIDKIKARLVEIVTNLTNKTGATVANVIIGALKAIPFLGNAMAIADALSNTGTKMIQKIINSLDGPAAAAAAADCVIESKVTNIANGIAKFKDNITGPIDRISNTLSKSTGGNNNKISGGRGRIIGTKRKLKKHRPNSITIKKTCSRINRFIKLHRL